MSRLGALGALSGLGQGVQNLGQQMYKSAIEERRMMLQEKLRQDAEERADARKIAAEDRAYTRLKETEGRTKQTTIEAEDRAMEDWGEKQQVLFTNAISKLEEQARVGLQSHKDKAEFDKANRDQMSMPLVYDDGQIRFTYQIDETGKMTVLDKGLSESVTKKLAKGSKSGSGATSKDYNAAMDDYSNQAKNNFALIKDDLAVDQGQYQQLVDSVGGELMMDFQGKGYVPNGRNMAYVLQEEIRKNPQALSREAAEKIAAEAFSAKDDRWIKWGNNFTQEQLDKAVDAIQKDGRETIKGQVKAVFYNHLQQQGVISPPFDPATGTYGGSGGAPATDGSLGSAQASAQAPAPQGAPGSSLGDIMSKTQVQDGNPTVGESIRGSINEAVGPGLSDIKEGAGKAADLVGALPGKAGEAVMRSVDKVVSPDVKGYAQAAGGMLGKAAGAALDGPYATLGKIFNVVSDVVTGGRADIKEPPRIAKIRDKVANQQEPTKAELVAYSAWIRKNEELWDSLSDEDKAKLDQAIKEAK